MSFRKGEKEYWDDLRTPLESSKAIAGKEPTFKAYQDIYAYSFAAGADNAVAFSCQFPHGYKEGSSIFPHIHCSFDVVPTIGQRVDFQLVYFWTSVNSIITGGVIDDVSLVIDASTVQFKHMLINFKEIAGTGKKISSMFHGYITRKGTTDTCTDEIFIFEFDIHYKIDTPGSYSLSTKY